MLRRLSIATKAMLTAVLVSSLMAIAQALGLAWAVRSFFPEAWAEALASPAMPQLVLTVAALFALTYGFAVASAGLWTRRVIRLRLARLVRALDRIKRGELRGELEPSIDTDLVVVHDALLAMQNALDALTSQLKHVDAQRRRLFADLTHELATPTATILAIAESLATQGDATERARHVALLEKESARLERLIGDMRDLARLDDPDLAFDRTRTDLGALVREVCERSGALDPGSAKVEAPEASEAWAEVDRLRIEQVLTNLIGNARRYTQPSGHIVVRARPREGTIVLSVDDDGTGVPDDMLPRLGERLLRIDPSRSTKTGGHGLGLAIVTAIVHRHGGTLRFERADIGGLRVEIVLPAA